jgi:hypothetical protein
MSLSPADEKKARAWLAETVSAESAAVHTLTADIKNPLEKWRDKRVSATWFEAPVLKAGLRLVLDSHAVDPLWRDEHFEKLVKTVTKLSDLKVRNHLTVRRPGGRDEMRWIRVHSYDSETVEFLFDADVERWMEHCNKRERAYAEAYKTLAFLLMGNLSTQPVDDLDALFARHRYPPSAETLCARLVSMGKVTLADLKLAFDSKNFRESEDES